MSRAICSAELGPTGLSSPFLLANGEHGRHLETDPIAVGFWSSSTMLAQVRPNRAATTHHFEPRSGSVNPDVEKPRGVSETCLMLVRRDHIAVLSIYLILVRRTELQLPQLGETSPQEDPICLKYDETGQASGIQGPPWPWRGAARLVEPPGSYNQFEVSG